MALPSLPRHEYRAHAVFTACPFSSAQSPRSLSAVAKFRGALLRPHKAMRARRPLALAHHYQQRHSRPQQVTCARPTRQQPRHGQLGRRLDRRVHERGDPGLVRRHRLARGAGVVERVRRDARHVLLGIYDCAGRGHGAARAQGHRAGVLHRPAVHGRLPLQGRLPARLLRRAEL